MIYITVNVSVTPLRLQVAVQQKEFKIRQTKNRICNLLS